MANGLMSGIINPAQANVLGALDAGRERQATDMAGEILGQTIGGKIGDLARISPDTALKFAEATGVPLTSQGRIKNLMGVNIMGAKLLQAGQIQEAAQFLEEEAAKVEELTKQPASRLRAVVEAIRTGNQEIVTNFIKSGLALDPTQGPSELDQARTAETQAKTRKLEKEISTPSDLPGDIKFKEFRTLNNDVTNLIKEPLKIRRAAERLIKIGQTKSPTDQLAAIFTFMKTLDPTSVVREGEQQAARSTGGPADQFVGFVNKLQGEGALPPRVFEEMIKTAIRLSDEAASGAKTELSSSLDAFGNRLKDEDKVRLLDRIPEVFEQQEDALSLLPEGSTDNGDGTYTLPTGEVVERE